MHHLILSGELVVPVCIWAQALAMFSSSSLVNLGLFSCLDSPFRKVTSFPSAVVMLSYLSGFLALSRVSQEFSNEDILNCFLFALISSLIASEAESDLPC